MAPNVTVPMNFGREMLNSPTHSNLSLNTSEGVVKASSVILSFNSPVISHMSGTLHMTSVDMLEFSEQAVRVFVDAAYSGTSEGLTRQVFRDVNKMSNVFEMSWLSSNCRKFYMEMSNAVKEGKYDDLSFLFEEAGFAMEHLKTRDFLKVVIRKVEQLKYKQEFLDQYLEGAERLSTCQLDAVLLLAGDEVNCVVETLTRQLTLQFTNQGPSLHHTHKYLLDNTNLNLCKHSNSLLFNQLFDILEQLPDLETGWVYKLYRKSDKRIKSIRSTQVVSRCNVIPNMYHKMNFDMSLREVCDWIVQSETISNVLMAFEALETWYFYNVKCQTRSVYISKAEIELFIHNIKQCYWYEKIPFHMEYIIYFWFSVLYDRSLFDSFATKEEEECKLVSINCQEDCTDPITLLSEDSKLRFIFKPPSIEDCNLPSKCGFILKTIPSNGGLRQLELCTQEEDYCNESIHFHKEVRAENMHVYLRTSSCWIESLSWLEFASVNAQKEIFEQILPKSSGESYRFYVLYKLNDIS